MRMADSLGLINPSKAGLWIIILLLVKMPHFIYRVHNYGLLGSWFRDSYDYIAPVENFLAGKGWQPEYRVPGVSIVYFLFRLMGPKHIAMYLFCIFQYVLLAIATYAVANAVYRITKSFTSFAFVLFFVGLNKYIFISDSRIASESLSLSSILFSIYFLLQFIEKGQIKYVSLSGLFITIGFFMRAILGIAILFTGMAYLLVPRRNLSFKIRLFFWFILPFIILESYWIARNYFVYGAFRPLYARGLTKPFDFTESHILSLIRFNGLACGPNQPIWEPAIKDLYSTFAIGDIGVPVIRQGKPFICHDDYIPRYYIDKYFDKCITTTIYNKDSLINLYTQSRYICKVEDKDILLIDSILSHKISVYYQSIKKEYPFYYYFTSRLKLFFHLLLDGPMIIYEGKSKLLNVLILMYYFLFYGGLVVICILIALSSLLLARSIEDRHIYLYLWISMIGLSIIWAYTFIFHAYEGRYAITTLPYLVSSAALCMPFLWKRVFRIQSNLIRRHA